MSTHADAVRRAARIVDVPGAPLTLRLDRVTRTGADLRLAWSFLDPEPLVRRVWTREEAWQALLTHLGAYSEYGELGPRGPEGAYVRVEAGVIHDAETTYVIDPDEWADYLSDPEPEPASVDASLETGTVPAAFPLVDGLPLWAVDELDEVAGSSGPVIGLVDGDLRELEPGEY